MTSSYTDEAQASAFHTMRATARSLKELADWLALHPHVLLDDGILGEPDQMFVNIDLFPGKYFMRVVNHEDILVRASIRGFSTLGRHPLLAKEIEVGGNDQSFSFNHERELALALKDWPLAAAIAASEQLIDGHHSSAEHYVAGFESNLDKALALHFPGMSTKRLQDLKHAELLGLCGNGTTDKLSIINLLFSTREPSVDAPLPELVT